MNALTESVVDLPGGPVAIRDSGGDGPMVVFVHGVFVDGRLWDGVWPAIASAGYRCVMPNLPLGAHKHPLEPDADRSPLGQGRRITALIRELGAERAVLVGNDSGGAICQILTGADPDSVDRLVLTSTDAFENFPPGFFRPLPLIARSEFILKATLWPLTRRPMRRAPGGLGWLSKKPIPDALLDDWIDTLFGDRAALHDLAGFTVPIKPQMTLDAAEQLRSFPRPALMAWSTEDRFFPYAHAERLAALMPQGRVVPIEDSYTFSPIDQPDATAEAIVSFLRDTEGAA